MIVPTPVSDRVKEAIEEFKKTTGHPPKRVVWAPDIHLAVRTEARAVMMSITTEDLAAVPPKQVRDDAEQPGMRFVSSRRVPPGVFYCDDLEGEEP